MKVVICAPYRTVAPHFETELEICELHLLAGDQVDFLACWAELSCCDFNVSKVVRDCDECQGRRRHGLSLLSRPIRPRSIGRNLSEIGWSPPEIASSRELRALKWGNFDWGYGVLSSLISHLRDPDPDVVAHRDLIHRCLSASLQTYLGMQSYLDQEKPDRVYLFNGRFAAMRAVLRACQERQVECLVHERGCDLQHYALFENEMPHDIPQMQHRMWRHWQAHSSLERESRGAEWFEQRRQRIEKNWHSFTRGQVQGKLPQSWPHDRRVITIFGSSDDEFAAIGDCWQNDLYATQWDGLEQLSRSLIESKSPDQICFRMHPNLARVDNAAKRRFLGHSFPNVFVLPAEDDIDTYAVMEASDRVMTFGSSMGAESVYWRRPTLLLGPCYYQSLPGIERAKSHQHVLQWLQDPPLVSDRTGALIYGFWLQTFGTRFQFFEPESLFHGRFKGQVVYNHRPRRRWWQFWKPMQPPPERSTH